MSAPDTSSHSHVDASATGLDAAWATRWASPVFLRQGVIFALGAVAAALGAFGAWAVFTPTGRPYDARPMAGVASPRPASHPVDLPETTPTPLEFKPVAPNDAYRINAAIPDARTPDPPARPFVLAGADATSRTSSVTCLADAVYYEAASESLEGQRAVAQVVLNRVNDARFPKTVCGVVFQGAGRVTGCQFSFTCDGSMRRVPAMASWRRAQAVAEAALDGYVMTAIGHATHYHTVWVTPYWSPSLVKWGRIGAHIFYRWAGGGRPVAPLLKATASGFPAAAMASDDAATPEPPILPAAQPPGLSGVSQGASAQEAPPTAFTATPSSASVEPPVDGLVPAPYHVKPHRDGFDGPAFAARDQGRPRF